MQHDGKKKKKGYKKRRGGGGDEQNLRKRVNNKGWLPIMSGKTDLQKGKKSVVLSNPRICYTLKKH